MATREPGEALATQLADLAARRGLTVAVAESLTGGLLASRLAAAPGASTWFAGGIVAYARAVKHDLLGVPPGPVVSGPAARAMAGSVARLLGADVALGVTGVGGPGEQDGEPPGTVFVARYLAGPGAGPGAAADLLVARWAVPGRDAQDICQETVRRALALLVDSVESLPPPAALR
ncbi:MAG: CinA family protein [Actinomycetota bacterium]